MAGKSCDMNGLLKIAKKYKLKIIEDCAHALGSHWWWQTFRQFWIYRFFFILSTKQITTGEGGMLVTNDLKLFNKINKLKAFGIDTIPQLEKNQVYMISNI